MLRWLLCINRRTVLLITHVHWRLPLIRALMYHRRCSPGTGKSTWRLRLPTIRSNLSRSENWHLGPGHTMWTHETSLRGIMDHHWSRKLLPWGLSIRWATVDRSKGLWLRSTRAYNMGRRWLAIPIWYLTHWRWVGQIRSLYPRC